MLTILAAVYVGQTINLAFDADLSFCLVRMVQVEIL